MKNIDTWANIQDEEDVMNDHHAPFWRSMANQMQEKDIANLSVLDFGCNQGGFLRTLYHLKPFKKGVGVDIAEKSLEIAKRLKGNLPIHYDTVGFLDGIKGEIDIAFSHDVIYLLPDLAEHAKQIKNVLKEKGIYYAATGCYLEMPLWNNWQDLVNEYSNVPVPNYSVNDFARVFWQEDFDVFIDRCKPEGFAKCWEGRENYFPKVTDFFDYYQNKIILRMVKK